MVVTATALPTINAGTDVSVCDGSQVTLAATGGVTYTWAPAITNGNPFVPTLGTTTYTVTGTDANGCIASDQVVVTVNQLPTVFAGNDVVICAGVPITLTASGAATYSWSPVITNNVPFTPLAGTNVYTVTGTSAAGCTGTDQLTVTVNSNLLADFTPVATVGCTPLTVTFTNNTLNSVNCVWNMGDGTTLTGCSTVTNTYEQPGCYDVTLTVTAQNGCISNLTVLDAVRVEAIPVAEFAPSTNVINEYNMEVSFNNNSTGASTYVWDFGDSSPNSTDIEPTHDYTNSPYGNYEVMLVAISPAGCVDTTYSVIQIIEELIYYVPNTFTPDGDTYNQTFKPVFTSGFDIYDYSLFIYNRWGEVIFESHDANFGWDGSYGSNNETEIVQDGTYTWVIEFKVTMNDERKRVNGHVNVLR
jgi:gliding motility-associated-like protein